MEKPPRRQAKRDGSSSVDPLFEREPQGDTRTCRDCSWRKAPIHHCVSDARENRGGILASKKVDSKPVVRRKLNVCARDRAGGIDVKLDFDRQTPILQSPTENPRNNNEDRIGSDAVHRQICRGKEARREVLSHECDAAPRCTRRARAPSLPRKRPPVSSALSFRAAGSSISTARGRRQTSRRSRACTRRGRAARGGNRSLRGASWSRTPRARTLRPTEPT